MIHLSIALKCTKFNRSVFWGPSKLLTSKTYEISKIPFFVKSGMNLSKYFKSSSDLNIIVIDCLSLTENLVLLQISNKQGVSRLMVHVKMDYINILTH